MELAEFIYLYSSSYHYNQVCCTLAIENWKDADCDVKYARYLQDYIKVRNILFSKDGNICKTVLSEYAKIRSFETYKFIFRNMIDEIKENYVLTEDEYDLMKSQLDAIKTDSFNLNFLSKAREIEENYYEKKIKG